MRSPSEIGATGRLASTNEVLSSLRQQLREQPASADPRVRAWKAYLRNLANLRQLEELARKYEPSKELGILLLEFAIQFGSVEPRFYTLLGESPAIIQTLSSISLAPSRPIQMLFDDPEAAMQALSMLHKQPNFLNQAALDFAVNCISSVSSFNLQLTAFCSSLTCNDCLRAASSILNPEVRSLCLRLDPQSLDVPTEDPNSSCRPPPSVFAVIKKLSQVAYWVVPAIPVLLPAHDSILGVIDSWRLPHLPDCNDNPQSSTWSFISCLPLDERITVGALSFSSSHPVAGSVLFSQYRQLKTDYLTSQLEKWQEFASSTAGCTIPPRDIGNRMTQADADADLSPSSQLVDLTLDILETLWDIRFLYIRELADPSTALPSVLDDLQLFELELPECFQAIYDVPVSYKIDDIKTHLVLQTLTRAKQNAAQGPALIAVEEIDQDADNEDGDDSSAPVSSEEKCRARSPLNAQSLPKSPLPDSVFIRLAKAVKQKSAEVWDRRKPFEQILGRFSEDSRRVRKAREQQQKDAWHDEQAGFGVGEGSEGRIRECDVSETNVVQDMDDDDFDDPSSDTDNKILTREGSDIDTSDEEMLNDIVVSETEDGDLSFICHQILSPKDRAQQLSTPGKSFQRPQDKPRPFKEESGTEQLLTDDLFNSKTTHVTAASTVRRREYGSVYFPRHRSNSSLSNWSLSSASTANDKATGVQCNFQELLIPPGPGTPWSREGRSRDALRQPDKAGAQASSQVLSSDNGIEALNDSPATVWMSGIGRRTQVMADAWTKYIASELREYYKMNCGHQRNIGLPHEFMNGDWNEHFSSSPGCVRFGLERIKRCLLSDSAVLHRGRRNLLALLIRACNDIGHLRLDIIHLLIQLLDRWLADEKVAIAVKSKHEPQATHEDAPLLLLKRWASEMCCRHFPLLSNSWQYLFSMYSTSPFEWVLPLQTTDTLPPAATVADDPLQLFASEIWPRVLWSGDWFTCSKLIQRRNNTDNNKHKKAPLKPQGSDDPVGSNGSRFRSPIATSGGSKNSAPSCDIRAMSVHASEFLRCLVEGVKAIFAIDKHRSLLDRVCSPDRRDVQLTTVHLVNAFMSLFHQCDDRVSDIIRCLNEALTTHNENYSISTDKNIYDTMDIAVNILLWVSSIKLITFLSLRQPHSDGCRVIWSVDSFLKEQLKSVYCASDDQEVAVKLQRALIIVDEITLFSLATLCVWTKNAEDHPAAEDYYAIEDSRRSSCLKSIRTCVSHLRSGKPFLCVLGILCESEMASQRPIEKLPPVHGLRKVVQDTKSSQNGHASLCGNMVSSVSDGTLLALEYLVESTATLVRPAKTGMQLFVMKISDELTIFKSNTDTYSKLTEIVNSITSAKGAKIDGSETDKEFEILFPNGTLIGMPSTISDEVRFPEFGCPVSISLEDLRPRPFCQQLTLNSFSGRLPDIPSMDGHESDTSLHGQTTHLASTDVLVGSLVGPAIAGSSPRSGPLCPSTGSRRLSISSLGAHDRTHSRDGYPRRDSDVSSTHSAHDSEHETDSIGRRKMSVDDIERLTRSTRDGREASSPSVAPAVPQITLHPSELAWMDNIQKLSLPPGVGITVGDGVLQRSCSVGDEPIFFSRPFGATSEVENQTESERVDSGTLNEVKPQKGKHFKQVVADKISSDQFGIHAEWSTLWVSCIEASVSQNELKRELLDCGCKNIKEVRLVLDHRKKSKGFAYVDFDTPEDARFAQGLINMKLKIKDFTLRAAISVPTKPLYEQNVLFISGVPIKATEEDVADAISKAAEIYFASLASPPKTLKRAFLADEKDSNESSANQQTLDGTSKKRRISVGNVECAEDVDAVYPLSAVEPPSRDRQWRMKSVRFKDDDEKTKHGYVEFDENDVVFNLVKWINEDPETHKLTVCGSRVSAAPSVPLKSRINIKAVKSKSKPAAVRAVGSEVETVKPKVLFISNLPYKWKDRQIIAKLKQYGPLRDFKLVRDPESKRSLGYAYAEFESEMDAMGGLALDGQEWDGRSIVVKQSTREVTHRQKHEAATVGDVEMQIRSTLGENSRIPRRESKTDGLRRKIDLGEKPIQEQTGSTSNTASSRTELKSNEAFRAFLFGDGS